MVEVLTTCTRNCPSACSMIATVENGKVIRLRGNPEHPPTDGVLCEKAPGFIDHLYSPRRVTRPMLRRDGDWVKVTWDEALDYVAGKVRAAVDAYGSQSIFYYQRGGSLAVLKQINRRFFDLLGGTTVTRGTLCNGAAVAAQMADVGEQCSHEVLDVFNSKLILLWGRDPATTQFTLDHLLGAARRRRIPIVAIDPIDCPSTRRAAWHIRPRPGTDGHLALAVARVILDRGWADLGFVERFTDGFAEYRQLVESRTAAEHAADADVALAAAERLAEWYATTKPASIWVGSGMQRTRPGTLNFRLVEALGALTGNLGVAGGGVSYENGGLRLFDTGAADVRPAPPRRQMLMPRLGEELPAAKDPPVRVFFCVAGNPVCQSPDSLKVAAALDQVDCVVVMDHYLTDTADHANVFLPATQFLEEEDLMGAQSHHWLGPVQPVAERVGEVRTDLEILQGLAGRLGIGDQMAGTARDWLRLYARPAIEAGIDFDQLMQAPHRMPGVSAVHAPDRRYKTPSGRFQLASATPPRPADDAEYPLQLLTMKDRRWTHSTVPDRYLAERPKVFVHPSAADAAGLGNGQLAMVRSRFGALEAEVQLRPGIRPDTVLITQGRAVGTGKGVNVLTEDVITDQGLSVTVYDTRVRLLPG